MLKNSPFRMLQLEVEQVNRFYVADVLLRDKRGRPVGNQHDFYGSTAGAGIKA